MLVCEVRLIVIKWVCEIEKYRWFGNIIKKPTYAAVKDIFIYKAELIGDCIESTNIIVLS